MVTPGWILQCLNQGAAGVGLLPCPGEECRFGERDELKGRVEYCREFLRETGLPPETVRLFEPGGPVESPSAEPLFPVSGGNGNGAGRAAPLFSPPGAAEAILGLARRFVNCGEPVAPQAMLDHITSLLGGSPVSSTLRKYCLECRKTKF